MQDKLLYLPIIYVHLHSAVYVMCSLNLDAILRKEDANLFWESSYFLTGSNNQFQLYKNV